MTATTSLDLALLHRLLGVPDHESPYRLVRRAQQVSGTLAQLVLSLAVAEGAVAGSGSTDVLDRARRRAARYAGLHGSAAAAAPVRIVKGPSMAAHYPAALVRPVGDLDLVVEGEAELWRAAGALCALGGDAAELTLFRSEGRRHLVLAVLWPAADPLMEEEIRVELSTAAFTGDFGAVPVRPRLPVDRATADLLSVAEERFQREFHAKDAVDLLVLLGTGRLDTAAVAAAAEEYRLAPELRALAELLRTSAEHPGVEPLLRALEAPADRELARRAAFPPRGPEPEDVPARLDAGLPVWGMPLTTGRRPGRLCRLEEHAGAPVARTPLGDFLLVSGELVDPDRYAAVLAAVAGQEASS